MSNLNINDLQEIGAREELRKILSKEPQELTDYESKFLRARRGYLSPKQKIYYSGVLYFSRSALYHETRSALKLLSRFAKQIVLAIVGGLIVFWIIKLYGW